MSTLVTIHGALANTTWLFFLALGIWGFYRAIRGQAINGSYLGATAVGQLLFMAQAVIGTILWIAGGNANLARGGMHVLYGVFAVVFIPFIYLSVLRGDDSNRGQWVLAFVTTFMFGIALRAIATSI